MQRKAANGHLPNQTMGNLEKSQSFQGARRQHHRSAIPSSIADQSTGAVYATTHPYKRQYNQQSSSLAHRQHHRRKQADSSSTTVQQQFYRRYDARQLSVPEPDYSQTDTEADEASIRIRNPSFWANSSDYYHRSANDEHERRDRPIINTDHQTGANTSNATSESQKKRHSNQRWSNEIDLTLPAAAANRRPDYSPHQQHTTLPTRKSRPIPDDHHPHVTTITLTDAGGSLNRANGDPFSSSHRLEQNNRRPSNFRTSGDQPPSNAEHRSAPSPRLDPVLPSSFSNVNLLKRVNDRYKLTERLLIQLKIIAVLHAFFGLAMFSLDSSQAAVLWPYVDEADERLYLILRTFYSLGVVLIGSLTIAISCGKRSVLLEIVKILCVVFLSTLLAAPAQTPFFRSIADSLQYNNVLRRHQHVPLALNEHQHRRRFAFPAETTPDSSTPFVSDSPPYPVSPRWKERKANGRRLISATTTISDFEQDSREIETRERDRYSNSERSQLESAIVRRNDQRRPRAFRVAQHLRIAYTIFACCHFLLTIGTLAVVVRLERIS